MNLPNLPFLKKNDKSEYFLSLVLRDEKVSAVVFEQVEGKVNVVGEHVEHFKATIEDSTDEELLDVIDKAVSTAEKNLPEGAESQKTIFGVKNDWIDDGKIKQEYLLRLKKVSEELGFKPVGFLVIPEAIAHLLHKEEGAPPTAILCEITKKRINLYLIKSGKLIDTNSGNIENSVPVAVEGLLKHFEASGTLPSKIILFNGGDENLRQTFIAHKWDKNLKFLHVPQVLSLPLNFDARAVLSGAATQMGFEVFEASGAKAQLQDQKETAGKETIVTEEEEDKTLAEAVSEFGFVPGDLAQKEKPTSEEEPRTAVSDNIEKPTIHDQFREIPEEVKLKTEQNKQLPQKAGLLMASVVGGLKKINFMAILESTVRSPKKFLIGLVPVIIIILLLYFYFFARSATVTIDINSRQIDLSEDVVFSQSTPTNASEGVVSAQFLTVSVDGKESLATTGKKETGEKAKGTLTIFNSSDGAKTIPAGTKLTAGDLVFLTDKAVTVASASGDIFSGTEPGKADTTVTAQTFGEDYNLGENTKFEISGTSSIAAKNDKALTGGTTKVLKIVSEEDVEKLEDTLVKQLEPKARDDILKQAEDGSVVLPNFISTTFKRQSFSKDVGDEANEVSLTSTLDFEGISYRKEDMKKFAIDKFGEELEKGLTINSEKLLVNAKNLEKEGSVAKAQITIKANLIPEIDGDDLARQISGKSRNSAQEIILKLPEIRSVDINSTFDFIPLLPKNLPFRSGKITIVIENG